MFATLNMTFWKRSLATLGALAWQFEGLGAAVGGGFGLIGGCGRGEGTGLGRGGVGRVTAGV